MRVATPGLLRCRFDDVAIDPPRRLVPAVVRKRELQQKVHGYAAGVQLDDMTFVSKARILVANSLSYRFFSVYAPRIAM